RAAEVGQVDVQVVGAPRVDEVRDVAVLAPRVLARVEGLEQEATRDPVLVLRARRLVAGAVGAERRLVLEDLADEGLRAGVAPDHVRGAELAAEARALVAQLDVPGPGEPGARIVGGDAVRGEGQARGVVLDASRRGEARLAGVLAGRLQVEVGTAVVRE